MRRRAVASGLLEPNMRGCVTLAFVGIFCIGAAGCGLWEFCIKGPLGVKVCAEMKQQGPFEEAEKLRAEMDDNEARFASGEINKQTFERKRSDLKELYQLTVSMVEKHNKVSQDASIPAAQRDKQLQQIENEYFTAAQATRKKISSRMRDTFNGGEFREKMGDDETGLSGPGGTMDKLEDKTTDDTGAMEKAPQ
jgi:hypothetical protein